MPLVSATLDDTALAPVSRSASRALDRLLAAPRYPLGRFPTPIESVALDSGPALLVKRDDLSGWGRGGAKARKIEHLVGHLRANGYDELVTVAGNITNLAFDLLPALDRAGIRASLFIIDDPPAHAFERERIFAGIRERVTLLGSSRRQSARAVAQRWLTARRAGRRPFALLPGVSHPVGVIANARGFLEMAMQRHHAAQPYPSRVYVSAATGTTVAGFWLAARALREAGYPEIEVIGVQVYPGAIERSVRALARWSAHAIGLSRSLPETGLKLVASQLSGGFGRYSSRLAERCAELSARGPIALDPIFGGKTWAHLEQSLHRERVPDERALFWHCGFTPEWAEVGRIDAGGGA